ncbi:GntR family transcriptional regulator, transcriptional repressor for pyruvate dehydrogenase complex [Cupriavidus sp. YR651]|uniref:FadR/GntR family transcriptional regulator n=1 Tax=Cupriavidus sp. YR651 TaxID=1855315 RepID=UPI000886D961|nr:FadR/GntR family transcriptional regulator [Cupriavidus sp. YR651]SDC00310.1 GntR family transcriptional regulator, transcriptional repressor for pyruvate dehydrogenase complex [Cupriavidus sp. YR651]
MFQKIPARALTDSVAEQLLEKIEGGAFPRGAKLPTEAVLSEEFGVSRTVIREAIARLKYEGLVESRQGSGVFVTDQAGLRPLRIDYSETGTLESVLQIVELRRSIEAEVAAQAARRRTDAAMVAIDAALARLDAAVAEGSDGVEADVAFHRAIAEATGNPFFLKTLAFLSQYLEAATRVTRTNEARREDFSRQVREEHQAIVAAIRAGDPDAARNAAQNHMYNAARRLSQLGDDGTPADGDADVPHGPSH